MLSLKGHFSPEQMKELALEYQKVIRNQGLGIPDDPWLQLVTAIEMVFDSWETDKASDYRKIMDVSDSWGTAVIVQAMVYGNKSQSSGSGVLFTAHPYRKVQRVALWGDYAYGDQGEDIVKEAAMAKLFAEQVLTRVSELALRIHGGIGYTKAYPMERHFRDARSYHFEEGTEEIQKLLIARYLLK